MITDVEQHRINLLPEHLIDQIKAGEVIERPASLVKELLENSLDAGATHIKITLIENGLDLISIEDNGDGILFEDLPYAFCRHATSKISRFEDIYNLHSFGFRGEALASMASISRITCVSTPRDNLELGGKIVIHGAQEISHTPAGGKKPGTSIFIKDLFYNTPARLKFIKSKTSEKNALKRIINAFILTNPHVQFSVKWDDKEKTIFKPVETENLSQRIAQTILAKKAPDKEFYKFEGEYEGHSVIGYTSSLTSRGNAGKQQFLFVNGRLFTDRQIHQTIIRNMEKAWPFGETGHYCVMLTVPASQVDVNVHPNKTQVKFFKANIVFSVVSASIKKFLEGHTPKKGPQEQLFSSDERRGSDLQMFSNSPFQTYTPERNSFSNPVNLPSSTHISETLEQKQKLQRIDQRYLIYELEGNNVFLLDSFALFLTYWLKSWKVDFPYIEENTTPLLISEPFELQTIAKQNFVFLRHSGLEIDALDETTYALRTIPKCFDTFNIREVLNDIILEMQHSIVTEENFENTLLSIGKKLSLRDFFLSEQAIFHILADISVVEALESKSIVTLDSQTLAKFFK
ncbi:hypothetical protein A9Q84_08305 [Halobacteriovorax marinus]|uniref:DNA mismatch repair protein MutL n=1 Tax=Halobacteriovorax marinus TaxID=97084 RepID=A0A1Y5F626_9BACT|nr:hypothetical protein A9Q84_08305 [Halobacteriovorax marinus]